MAATLLDRSDGAPLWSQLQDDLLRRIGDGEFDRRFPGELALVQEYAVSRNTVRQALAQLRADGVVTAGRGRPPRVDRQAGRPEIPSSVGAASTLFDVVERTGRVRTSVVRALVRTSDGVVAARLGLEESTPLLHLERLRYADDEPLAWDRVWLPYDLAAPLLGRDLSRTALDDELERCAGIRIDEGRERIRIALADRVRAQLLGIAPGDPVFHIERTGAHRGELVEWRQTVIRGDRFSLTADFGTARAWQLAPRAVVATA
ncbi:GntR family transcriptional regulator [Actinomycetospora sp. NBRC 106378]|uniref:GntR family transcriptional regulator n=1 Tax=Actinomycetospora sp. NBRC 106378 TaxID=3032208 RepID=UPI0024A16893|nr:GntR family transcriptional regulator [Actinomycetospora sp. NBRC 106378]GLZ55656.1 GntR family transcriptional regulator [Actinomycetospora sp. NBRC 106378]